jgi:hypothetical protein
MTSASRDFDPSGLYARLERLGVEEIDVFYESLPRRMVGSIGHPEDRTVRYGRPQVSIELTLTVDGMRYAFCQAEAQTIAMILVTEIPQ